MWLLTTSALSPVHTSNDVEATLLNATSQTILSTKSKRIEHDQFASSLSKGLNFTTISFDSVAVLATKSNVSSILLPVWTGLYAWKPYCQTVLQFVEVWSSYLLIYLRHCIRQKNTVQSARIRSAMLIFSATYAHHVTWWRNFRHALSTLVDRQVDLFTMLGGPIRLCNYSVADTRLTYNGCRADCLINVLIVMLWHLPGTKPRPTDNSQRTETETEGSQRAHKLLRLKLLPAAERDY